MAQTRAQAIVAKSRAQAIVAMVQRELGGGWSFFAPKAQIALCHGGVFTADPVLDTDQYLFPDGSELSVKRTNPVRCTVLAYPNT